MRMMRLAAIAVTLLIVLVLGVSFAQTASNVEIISNVEYGNGGGRPLKLDIVRPKVLPKTPMPVVVYVHGGGWDGGNKESYLPAVTHLAKRGYFCATIDYRLSGEAKWPAQIEDCKCAIRWMRAHAKEYNVNPNQIGVWGDSAGGHLVALLGTSGGSCLIEGKGGWKEYSSRVNAVCDWYGPVDFLWYHENAKEIFENLNGTDAASKLFGGPFWERPGLCKQASPLSYISKDDPPFLIMQGDKDLLVPLAQSQMLDAALKKVGVASELVIIKGAGHGFPGTEPLDRVASFFDKCFGRSTSEGN